MYAVRRCEIENSILLNPDCEMRQNPSISRDRRKLRAKSWEWLEVVKFLQTRCCRVGIVVDSKLCFQSCPSFCIYSIANLHRNFPDCICSYDGFMVENLRMHRTSKFDRISYSCTCVIAIYIARAIHLLACTSTYLGIGILMTSSCIGSCMHLSEL